MITFAREKGENTKWYSQTEVQLIYFTMVCGAYWLLFMLFGKEGATLAHLIHTMILFGMFHMTRGQPFNSLKPEDPDLTIWEQMDGEKHFTSAKKFYTIMVIALFAVTIHLAGYGTVTILTNGILFLVSFIPKSPYLHKIRLFETK